MLDIISDGGSSILIGDDIRGFSSFDLTQFSEIQNSRQRLDSLIRDIGTHLSSLEYDFANSFQYSDATPNFNISIGCDNIMTSGLSSDSLIIGDSLTILGRTFLGSFLPDPLRQVEAVLERHYDIELALINFQYLIYEIHLTLLQQMQEDDLQSNDLAPSHSLSLADDIISCQGANDIAVGDSASLYFQIDSPLPSFEFSTLPNNVANGLSRSLQTLSRDSQQAMTSHVQVMLRPSSVPDTRQFPWDVPFHISTGNDNISLYESASSAVGDYACFGLVFSEEGSQGDINGNNGLQRYTDSIDILRRPPDPTSNYLHFLYRGGQGINPNALTERYGNGNNNMPVPLIHSDTFIARSDENVMFGDFLSAPAFMFGQNDFTLSSWDFFGSNLNSRWAQYWNADTVYVLSGNPLYFGQNQQNDVM